MIQTSLASLRLCKIPEQPRLCFHPKSRLHSTRAAVFSHGKLRKPSSACGAPCVSSRSRPLIRSSSSKENVTSSVAAVPLAESGSTLKAALLVAGCTVGAGMLALPVVTQEAGFVASSAGLFVGCGFNILTGLLLAEVNLKVMMSSQRKEGVSFRTMASITLGDDAASVISAVYVAFSLLLLNAYVSRAGRLVADITGMALPSSTVAFVVLFSAICFASNSRTVDTINSALVLAMLGTFVALVLASLTGGNVDPAAISDGNWEALPSCLPVIALSFVYHNVVPVIVQNLNADAGKVRTAIIAGSLLPLFMFCTWEYVILGSLHTLQHPTLIAATLDSASAVTTSTLSLNPTSALAILSGNTDSTSVTQLFASSSLDSLSDYSTVGTSLQTQLQSSQQAGTTSATAVAAAAADPISAIAVLPTLMLESVEGQAEVVPLDPLRVLASASPVIGPLVSAFSFFTLSTSFLAFLLSLTGFVTDTLATPETASKPSQQTPTTTITPAINIPRKAASALSQPALAEIASIKQEADAQRLKNRSVAYVVTLIPPLGMALAFPDAFVPVLDAAGSFGALSLFGVLPAVMAWRERYGGELTWREGARTRVRGVGMGQQSRLVDGRWTESSRGSRTVAAEVEGSQRAWGGEELELVPGGKVMLLALGGLSGGIVITELVEKLL